MHIRLMLFQIANCILNYIWGHQNVFSAWDIERFKSGPEPRPGGIPGVRN